MWRRQRNTHVLLHVRAYGDSPVSLAMTHMRWAHGQGGHESTDSTTFSVVPCVGGLRAWPIDKCSDKDAGRSERETPTLCEPTGPRTRHDKTKQNKPTNKQSIKQETYAGWKFPREDEIAGFLLMHFPFSVKENPCSSRSQAKNPASSHSQQVQTEQGLTDRQLFS